jgi:putative ABC transport system substrate-binding protein
VTLENKTMKKFFPLALALFLYALGSVAEAQQGKKIARVGYLSAVDASAESNRSEAFRRALREAGYVEGQNVSIEYRYADGKVDRATELASDLVRLKADVIVVSGGDRMILAVKRATTLPTVMTGLGSDPVAAGFVETLARPGGNVTGLTTLSRELGGKRLELLKEAVPKAVRVAVLYDPAGPAAKHDVKEILPVSARALGLTIRPWELRDTDDLEKLFTAVTKDGSDGLYVPDSGPFIRANGKRIAGFAIKSRLPSVYNERTAVEGGGLLYYGADVADSYRRVAYYVDRILKGTKPAELAIEQPTKFELVINLKTAKQIGVSIPQSMLYRADRVIK